MFDAMILPVILKFLVGLAILLTSTRVLTTLAERLSLSLKISPLLIGLTFVAIGTSLPELAFSTTAALTGDHGLAMGNIVGSNIVNVLLVFPVGVLVGKLRVGTTKTQRNVWVLFIVSIAFVMLQLFQVRSGIFAFILLCLGGVLTFFQYRFAQDARNHEDKKMFVHKKRAPVGLNSLLYSFPIVVGVIFGSFMTVDAVEQIALITDLSTTVLGLSLSAIATSLPELMTTIFSQRQHQDKLTLGNIMGSNMYNLVLIGALVIFLSGSAGVHVKDVLVLFVTTAAFVLILITYQGKSIPKHVGWVGLACFLVYIMTLT